MARNYKGKKGPFPKGKGEGNRGKRDMDRNREHRRDRGGRGDTSDDLTPMNDISWYSRNPELLAAAGAFPFPYRPGMTINMGSLTLPNTTSANVTQTVEYQIPGVMRLEWMPTIGHCELATDPASVVSKEIYAKVRNAYSGSLDVDAPDFMTYFMGLDSIFAFIAWTKRLYRTLATWSGQNYNLPDKVLQAMGVLPTIAEQMRQNRMKLFQVINELILQSRKFTCPALMDVFNRHYWMSDNVYMDAPSMNAQFYLFNCTQWYKVGEVTLADGSDNKGVGCVITPLTLANLSVENLYNYGRDLIDAMAAWDDCYTINGYLSRAYEGVPSFVVDELRQDELLTPVYEEEVLIQIENSRAMPGLGTTVTANSNTITQNPITNAVVCLPTTTIANAVTASLSNVPPTLSIRSDNPTVADNVIATRLQSVLEKGTGTNVYNIFCGTEIPIAWTLYYGSLNLPIPGVNVLRNGVSGVGDYAAFVGSLAVEQFDWHPIRWLVYDYTPSGTPNYSIVALGDVHNITTTTVDAMKNLHKICLFSEFNAFQR